ncbi:MAG: RHS repeat-associated core domain-containing protein, partial [Actinomycetia bacterium]|nr:RHS repeat-associated core domain-containing protein [Actinomycetes bacterium]
MSNSSHKIEYDAWGMLYKGKLKHSNNFGYNSKLFDSKIGVYNYGFRHYSPDRKQWNTVDPVRDGVNWKTYLGGVGDPVGYVDPDGLFTIIIINYGMAVSKYNDVKKNSGIPQMDKDEIKDYNKREAAANKLHKPDLKNDWQLFYRYGMYGGKGYTAGIEGDANVKPEDFETLALNTLDEQYRQHDKDSYDFKNKKYTTDSEKIYQ